jgi:MoxR-like ATPase
VNTLDYQVLLKALFQLKTKHALHVPVCIWGKAGIGKTAIPHEVAKQLSQELGKPVRCVVLKPGQADSAGDLVGMPEKVPYFPCPFCLDARTADGVPLEEYRVEELAQHVQAVHHKTVEAAMEQLKGRDHLIVKKQRFAVTDVWPTSGLGILVIDEINRAPGDIQNSLLGLVQECVMEMTGYRVPPGFIIVATANPPTSDYVATQDMDLAMVTRMAHFDLIPEDEHWLSYLRSKSYAEHEQGRRLVSFFGSQKKFIGCEEVPNPVIEEHLKPCPRQAENLVRLSHVLKDGLLVEAARGTIGPIGATELQAYLSKGEEIVTGKEILRDYEKVRPRVLEYRKDPNNVRNDAFGATV